MTNVLKKMRGGGKTPPRACGREILLSWLGSCLSIARIAVTGGEGIRQLGYWYALVPCLAGACLMLFIALIVNNLPSSRRYPLYWW